MWQPYCLSESQGCKLFVYKVIRHCTVDSGQWTVGPRQYLKLLTSALWILIRVLSLNCFRRNFVLVAQWNFGNIIVSSQCPAELDIDHCWPNIAPSAAEARQRSGDTVAGRRPAWPQRGTCGVRSTWPSSSGRSCSGNWNCLWNFAVDFTIFGETTSNWWAKILKATHQWWSFRQVSKF